VSFNARESGPGWCAMRTNGRARGKSIPLMPLPSEANAEMRTPPLQLASLRTTSPNVPSFAEFYFDEKPPTQMGLDHASAPSICLT